MSIIKRTMTVAAVGAMLAAGAVQAQSGTGGSAGVNSNNNASGAIGAGVNANTGVGANVGIGTDTRSGVGVNMGTGANMRSDNSIRGPETQSNRMPAVATPDSHNSKAPIAGANSFTQSQVMTRLSRAGYTNIANLQKGSDGIWRGTGSKDGTTQNLMFDYQGNISTGVR